MSKGIRYDALLVRALGAELRAACSGAETRALAFDGAQRLVTLAFADGRALRFDLDPDRGWVTCGPGRPPRGAEPLPGCAVAGIEVPPDERRLHVAVRPPGGGAGFELVVDWTTTRWNAWWLAGEGRAVLRVLRRARGRAEAEAGRADAGSGDAPTWTPPAPTGRAGADRLLEPSEWLAILSALPADGFERAALRSVAYLSPLNLAFVLGPARGPDDVEGLRAAYGRWRALVESPPAPHVLARPWGAQPYPHPLGEPDARPVPSLLDAMAELRRAAVPPVEVARARSELERRQAALERRIEQLRAHLRRAEEAAERQHEADLLLANLARVPRGADRVELEDFDGRRVTIALDPARPPAENAQRLYAEARRLRRAAARVPALLDAATRELERIAEYLEAVNAGQVPPAVRRWVRAAERAERAPAARTLPYRRYRTSGGLEVRVGKSARANDELTFGHASPNDVWMHARDAPGSHVVLRWPHRDANPPERDLVEAATLAAWFSRARHSRVVPVDWTRRRYVRKPRKAPPGQVVLERARTIFVEPRADVVERMRADDEAAI